jgi:hypothetical protein
MANRLLRSIIALLTIALVAFAASVRLATPSAAFVSEDVVINEFRTNGPNGADDEFIELANISDSVVNLDGWHVASLTGLTESTRIPVPSMLLPPGAHVLLTGPRYSGVVRGDWLYNQGITDNCSIRLWNAAGRLVDAVSTEVGFLGEGGRLPTVDRDDDWSYERVRDTDDNDQDFRLISPSNPHSVKEAPLSATGSATPAVVNPGDPLLLTIKVTSPPPLSTGLYAFCPLDSLGGSGGQLLFDDGTHGDAVPGDRIFSLQITLPFGTELGMKTLTACAVDKQNRSTCATISFDVGLVAPAPSCFTERFQIKTGTDEDVDSVALVPSGPSPTTIESIRNLAAPQTLPAGSRVAPFETTVWLVSARLTAFKMDEDSAYRLILEDAKGESIIVRIPCPCCVESGSPFRSRIAAARTKFGLLFSASGTLQEVSVPVFVEGVGFFDSGDDATAGAQNGAGLYPILNIDFNIDPGEPRIVRASISGKKLSVFGVNFDDGANIFIGSEKQKTVKSDASTSLIAKKAGKKIERGQEVTLTVKNANGSVSNGITFKRPN